MISGTDLARSASKAASPDGYLDCRGGCSRTGLRTPSCARWSSRLVPRTPEGQGRPPGWLHGPPPGEEGSLRAGSVPPAPDPVVRLGGEGPALGSGLALRAHDRA